MRIYFRTTTLPKKAAKRVKEHFSLDFMPDRSMKLSEAQNLTARMLGYAHWHELEQITIKGSNEPSPLDEECKYSEQSARIDYQSEKLSFVSPLIEPVLRQIALKLRVSAGMKSSDNLIENAYKTNLIRPWYAFDTEQYEWRFFPSTRSEGLFEELYESEALWKSGELSFGKYIEELEEILQRQPENITAICCTMRAALEVENGVEYIQSKLATFEKEVDIAIPLDFPRRKMNIMPWGNEENRDFHRAVGMLAECYYRLGKYKKSKSWFNFSCKTCAEFKAYNTPYLNDLRSKVSKGNVHQLHLH